MIVLAFRQRGCDRSIMRVIGADDNSCSGGCTRGREGGTSNRLRKTTVVVVQRLDQGVDKWHRGSKPSIQTILLDEHGSTDHRSVAVINMDIR